MPDFFLDSRAKPPMRFEGRKLNYFELGGPGLWQKASVHLEVVVFAVAEAAVVVAVVDDGFEERKPDVVWLRRH